MALLGDRRAHVRLEVVGTLWGSLEWIEAGRAVNISTTGLLVESLAPMAPESRQSLNLMVDGEPMIVDAHVRRLEQIISDNHRLSYLIGFEFISPPLRLVQWVENLSIGT